MNYINSIGAALTAGPLEEAEKAFAADKSDKNYVALGYARAIQAAEKITHFEDRKQALRRLNCGSVKRSKILGVDSPGAVMRMIKNLGPICMKKDYPDGRRAYRFPMPQGYKGSTPTAKVKELVARGGMFADSIHPCGIRKDGVWEYHFHAPKMHPVHADQVTFILDAPNELLLEWFAGEDIFLDPPNGDPGSHWVHLGVDLVAEHMRNRPRRHQ